MKCVGIGKVREYRCADGDGDGESRCYCTVAVIASSHVGGVVMNGICTGSVVIGDKAWKQAAGQLLGEAALFTSLAYLDLLTFFV